MYSIMKRLTGLKYRDTSIPPTHTEYIITIDKIIANNLKAIRHPLILHRTGINRITKLYLQRCGWLAGWQVKRDDDDDSGDDQSTCVCGGWWWSLGVNRIAPWSFEGALGK